MSDYSQNYGFPPPSGTGSNPGLALVARRSLEGHSALSWPAEPSFAEMISDPVFQKMMASDRISMESFNGLVSVVRKRLGR